MNSGINCVVDTPILQELYNKVKNKVESYEEFKTLVSLWWRREKQKNPQFDYEVYPSPEEIDSLLAERTNKKEEEMGSTISYTPKGKRTQVYTIKGSHIYNRDGKEVFAKDSIDRNKIFANLAVKSGRAVVVEHNNSRYVVNNRNQIISVATGKIMQWDEKNGDRNAIIKAAQEKFNSNKSKSQKQQLKFETTAEVQAYLKQKYASNSSNAKLTDLVFAALNKFNIKFKSVNIESKDGHSVISGKFVANKNTIEINSNPEFISENTILHEAIHAVTSYYLKAASTNGFSQEIQIAIKEINECYKLLKQDFIETHFYKNGKLNPEVNVEAAFDFWISGSNDLYGYTSPNEMVAELSNPNFVQHIKDFDNRHKGKNIFQRLIDAIASLFGINKSYGSLEGTLKKALTTLLTNPNKELAERYNRENATIKENVDTFLKSRHIIISSNKIEQDIISQLPEEDSTDKDYFDVTIKTPKDLANFVFSTSKEGANHIFTKSHKGDIYTTSSGLHMVLVAPVEITENEFIHKLRVLNSTALSLNKFNTAQGESGIDYITDIDNIISRNDAYFSSLKSEAVEEAPNISLSTVSYKKGDPQRNPNTDYVFTENAEAYAYSNGTDLSPFGVKFPNPNKPKINVSDVSGTNQAGIRTDNNGNISQNAYGIVVKKYQQDANGRFVAKEGQFQNTEEDFKLFTSLNEDMFDRLSKSSNKEIVFPTQMGLGKAALPLRFAEWLKNELENRFGIVSKIEKNTRADYDGFGLKLLSVKQSQNSESEAVEEAPIFEDNETSSEERGTAINNFIPFSEEIEELSLEERGLTPAINPNDLEAKADVAFGTPQRRRDRVNLVANAIRQNFSIEFERQKRALQERISSETDADKIVELQEQLDTLDEKRAVELGLNNILVRIKKMFQPKDSLPAYYNSEFVKLQDNWDTVVAEALELLKETDGLAVDFIEANFDDETQIDEESGDYINDDSQKEYGYKDGWMTKARFVSQRDSLSKKVRKIIWTTDKIGFDGKPEIDDLGFKRYLQPDMVQATLLQALGQARNSEHFWKILNDLAKRKKWVQPLIDRLNKEEDTKSQFYQNFRKEFMPYWVQLQKEVKNTDGEVISVVTQTKRVNKIPGIMHMLDEWRDNYEEGSKLDEFSVYKEGQQIDKENASKAFDYISELQNSYPEDVNEWIESDDNLNKVMRVLHMAGITADAEVVREALKGEDLQDGTQRLDKIYQLLSGMFRDIKDDKIGKTVSSDGTIQYDDLLNAYDSAYTVIARIIDTIPEDSILSSFREAGNSYQSYSAPSYLGKLINNLKNLEGTVESLNKFYQEQYGQYKWFYSKNTGYRSSWLRQLVSSQSKRDLLDRKIILHSGKLEFNDWGNSEYAKVMISEFLSTADNNSAWYYLPLLADAESAEFIKFTKYTNSSVQDESGNYIPYDRIILSELEDVVRQEYDRIMLVRQREGKVNPIANFDIIRDKDGEEIGVIRNSDGDIISRNTGNEFKFFPELNTYKIDGRLFIDVLQEKILRNDSDVSSFIQSALSDIMESGFAKFMKTMDEAGVLETTNGVSKYFQINASELEETLRNFYWNNALAQTQLIELTTTDIAYYKDMRDFQKRFKEVYAQTLKLNTEATFNGEKVGRQTGRVAYLKDLKMVAPSKEALKQMLEGRVEAGAISELDKDAILNHFNKVNVADAQAYRTLDSYRRVLVMSGRWTQTDEDAMNRLKNGTWNIKDFNTIWQTIKPFMYTQGPRPSGVADYGNIKVPSQYKNSEFLLLAMYNTIATPLQDSSVLRAINEFMEENDIDMVMFESAVKAGNQAPIKIDINMSLPDIKNLLNSKIKNSDGSENAEVIHEFDYEDYGIQVETPEHMVDKYQLFGTQIRKLISSDMADNIEISLFGSKKKYSKAEWWTLYNGLITANVVDSYNEVAEEFSSIEHVAEIIQSELKGNTRYSDEIKKACELIEVTNPLTGETEKVFNLPLYDPVQSERVQHLLNSIIKKKVVKQTIKGGTGIQVSAYGLTDKLSIVWEGEGKNRRMKYMECFLPAYSKEFFEPLMKFKTVNGEQVGYLDINELPEELRRIIGYRIPTEDKYSMAPLYIKGFLPQENGSMIMLPAEITELTGSDFDVDKFYLMFPEFYVQKFNYSKAKEDFQRLNKITDEVASWFKNSDLKEAFDEAPQSFKEWFEDNKESYRYDKPRIIYYKYDYSKSTRENSVQQRNNQLINMIWGVLTNQDTVEKQLNPGNFEKAKIAARICSIANNADSKKLMNLLGITDKKLIYDALTKLSLDELDSISSSFIGVLSPISPTTQLFFHSQNATGGKMIGIYANNNASHAIVQHTKLSCVPFTIDGHEYKSLHSIKNEKGNYITRNISNFLAASVDNVKDPVLKDLMQDTITGDLSCFMLRAGVEPNEVGLFMNQPIVKKIIEALRENEFGDRKAIINSVIDSWAKQRQWKTSKEDAERYKNLYSEDLFNAILFEKDMQKTFDENATKGEKGWFNFQLYVGNAFKNMYATSNDLSELTAIMRADTSNGSAGPSNADTYNKINRILRFQERMMSDRFNLINAELISFSYPKEGEDIYDLCMKTSLPFLNAFTIAGIGGTMVLMKKYFPHFNASIYNMLFDPEFGLTTYLKEGRTNTKFINTVLNDLLVYVMSKTQFFNSYIDSVGNVHTGIENRKRFIIDFPNEFIKTVNENPDIAENRFVSRIRLKYPKRGANGKLPIASLVFRNSGKLSTIQRDMYSRDWLSLLYSSNPKAVELGLNLFKYASFMGGFGFGPNSFIHMAPVLLRKAIPGYEQTLRNLVKKDDYFPFIRQFILNHMDMPNLVPQYAEKDLSGITYSNYDRNFEATPNNSSFVKEQVTTTDESKNMVLMNKLIPFISIIKPNGTLTYFEADSWYVADGQPIRYHEVSPLGFKGKVLEYEYGKSNFDSVFYKVQRLKEDMVSTTYEDEEDELPSKEIAPYDSVEQVEAPIPEGFDVSFKQNIENYEATPVEDANGQISCGGFDLEGSPLFKL